MQTKYCKHCKSQILVNAMVCPFCGKKQNGSPLPWILIAFVGLIVLAGLFGSSDEPKSVEDSNSTSSVEDDSNLVSNVTSNESKSNEQEKKSKKDFNQNEIVEYEGVRYRIVSVKKSQGSTWDTPNKGKEYVIVTLKIENNSTKKLDYNEYDWKMSDSTGNEESHSWSTIDSDHSINSGSLDKGGVKQGSIVFEKPKGDKGLRLRFYDSFLDDDYTFQFIIK